MQYGDLITRSFSIVWRHKYLWLLAILGGADVGGNGFGGNFANGLNGFNRGSTGGTAGGGFSDASATVSQFLQDNLWLIVAGGLVVVVVAIAWFLLSCVTTGALVRASAEHDAERPFGLGLAWRTGLGTFWSILGLRLLGLLFGVVSVALIVGLVVLGVASYLGGQPVALALVIVVGILVVLALVVAWILVGIAFILATRAVVLEQRGAVAALGRGFQLLGARLGRVLLVWLLQVGLALAGGVGLAIVLIPMSILVALIVVTAGVAGGGVAAIVLAVPLGLVLFAVVLVLGGILGGYLSMYWTLAFRRMELDLPRPAYWPPPQYPPQPAG